MFNISARMRQYGWACIVIALVATVTGDTSIAWIVPTLWLGDVALGVGADR